MRILLLFRGSPASGKSTFIEQNGLKQFTLSPDDIRIMYQSPILNKDGNYTISMKNDKKVWNTLFNILEERMERGEFIVIDSTNSKTSEFTRYKKLAEKYRYRIFCIDKTNVSIEECKKRNRNRLPKYKIVPDTVIDNMYSRFSSQNIPSGIKVIKEDELFNTIEVKQFDLNKYNKIHHIGDIHGCYTALKEYMTSTGGLKDDEFYIFTGDYIDRGIENDKVLNYLFKIMNYPNVLLLQGNHERWLWNYANDEPSKSREFENVTKVQLNKVIINKKDIRKLYRKLGQMAYYTYDNKVVFVCHGGISKIPDNLFSIATEELIKGVGEYKDMLDVDNSFVANTSGNYYQIHGHRNIDEVPVQVNERCFNLEGKVELGGYLRVVTLDKENGFKTYEIKNDVYKTAINLNENIIINDNNANLIANLRNNPYIKETKYYNISSFNFTSKAFYKGIWDNQTVRARGLFFNTVNNEIVIRSYDKFFNINEKEETKIDNINNKISYPLTAYVKYNGFLGLVGYDKLSNSLLITSKSNPDSEYANYFKNIFNDTLTEEQQKELVEFIKINNVTLVFECIDPINDPHMIKYDKKKIVLLDIVNNDINFSKKPYEEVLKFANRFNLEVKEKAKVFNNWSEFYNWYNEVIQEDYKYNNEYIEGFVLEDSNNFMFKLKLSYYKFWKQMRTLSKEVLKYGYCRKTSSLNNPLANSFYGWLREQYEKNKDILKKDIISLREMYYKNT